MISELLETKMPGKVTLSSQDQQNIGKFRLLWFRNTGSWQSVVITEFLDVDFDVIKQSKIVAQMMSDLATDESTDMEPLPIPNVNSAILKKVIEWCK